jgi:hypothetical protein
VNELLERRYRTVLRLLPRSYRAEREEEMVAAYMESSGDVPDHENPYPRWGEVASVIALSTRVRLGGAGAGPRYVAWGAAVRLVALVGLGYHAAAGTFTVASLVPVAPGPSVRPLEGVSAMLWVAAYVLAMRGQARIAKPVALTAGLGTLTGLMAWLGPNILVAPLDIVPQVLNVVVPVTALLVGFHDEAPATRRPWRAIVSPPAAGLLLRVLIPLLLASGLARSPVLWLWVDLMGLATVALVVAGAVCLVRRVPPHVPLALAILGGLTLVSRLPLLDNSYLSMGPGALWVSGIVQCAALVVVVAALGVTADPDRESPG